MVRCPENDEPLELDETQKIELDKMLYELENGIGRTYSWDEVVVITNQALADRKKSKSVTK